MLKFRLFGIPIGIEWWFWISAILLSGGVYASGPDAWAHVVVRSLVIFVSIMIHELGHALVGRRFGANPGIKLHGFGGVTLLPGASFTRIQSIAVSAAGPIAGLALWVIMYLAGRNIFGFSRLGRTALATALHVNFVWSLFNLLPIQPLDGGQILREILGPGRLRLTSLIGGVLAVLVCVWSLRQGYIVAAFFLAMFAYYNFRQAPMEGGVIKD